VNGFPGYFYQANLPAATAAVLDLPNPSASFLVAAARIDSQPASTSTFTVTATGGASILGPGLGTGVTSVSLNTQGATALLWADGTNWHFLNTPPAAAWYSAPGTILTGSQYATAANSTYTTTSNSPTAIDTNNLTLSFTAPSSGQVWVRWSAFVGEAGGGGNVSFGLVTHGTSTVVGAMEGVLANAGTSANRETFEQLLTGLTAGTTYNLDLAWTNALGTTTTIYYGNSTSYYGPVTWVVTAA
jgi:hypothetical protein